MPQPETPLQLLNAALDRFQARGGTLLVAVSGGRDSMALLHLLRRVALERSLHLIVAHLNHGLRGAASDADQTFVAAHCRTLAIPLRTETLPIRELAAAGKRNLEAEARHRRYVWLKEQAAAAKARWIATAHHADDQAETVLHHLVRGAHLAGLRGIAPRKALGDGIWLLRPLLKAPRAAIERAVSELGLPIREDESNADVRLTRNFLRHEILARLMARFGPRVLVHFGELAEEARRLQRRAKKAVRRLLRNAERPRVGAMVILHEEALAAAREEALCGLFVRLWRREGWPREKMTRRHWRALAAFVKSERKGLELPGKVRAERRGKALQLGPTPDAR